MDNNQNSEYSDDFLFADLENNNNREKDNNEFNSESMQAGSWQNDDLPEERISDNSFELDNYEGRDEKDNNDDSTTHPLSWISLALFFAGGVIESILYSLFSFEDLNFIGGISAFASFITMIVANVMYPKDVVARVIKWIWIVAIVLAVVGIILLIIACNTMCSSCQGL